MASIPNPPSEPTGEFELPPSDAIAAQSRKEVSWSPTPGENEQEMIEKRKVAIKYEIAATLSVKVVLKETITMFHATDESFMLVSKEDPTVLLKRLRM